MLLGPVFRFELITATRRARYFVMRALYGLALLVMLTAIYGTSGNYDTSIGVSEAAGLARSFFVQFSWMQLLLVLGIGPALAAGTIALERERGTIEYLFTSQLTGAEIVLSKLGARLLYVLSLVVVGLPVLAIFRLLGGIAGDQLLIVFLLTVSTMVLVTVVGVTVSIWSQRARDAVIRVYLLFAAVLLIPLFGYRWLAGTWADFLYVLNPLVTLAKLLDGPAAGSVTPDWDLLAQTLTWHAGIALLCAVTGMVLVRRVHLWAAGRGDRPRFAKLASLNPLPRRKRQMGDHPMVWKELFARSASIRLGFLGRITGGVLVLSYLAAIIYAFIMALDDSSGRYWGNPIDRYFEASVGPTLLLSCITLLMIGARAAGSITGEKDRDTWISLLSTTLEAREIVWAKWWGAIYAVRWLMVLAGVGWGLGAFLNPNYCATLPFTFAVFGVTAAFASALGVRFSLWCSSTLRAMGATITTMLVVGGLYLMCCLPIFASSGDEAVVIFFSPCVPALLVFPSVIFFEPGGPQDFAGYIIVALLLGTGGYAVAAGLLYSSAVTDFDEAAGRIRRGSKPRKPPSTAVLPAQPTSGSDVSEIFPSDAAEEPPTRSERL